MSHAESAESSEKINLESINAAHAAASSWLRGDAEEAGTNPAGSWAGNSPPDDGEGATTVDTSSGETTSGAWYTGDPEVDKVLKAFYENGTCTTGWLIFVNGAQVC